MNKLIIILAIGILVYFILLNPSQKEVVNVKSVHALNTGKTFFQGGVAAVRENSVNSDSSGDGNTTSGG